tara:strand:- start:313 stop:942 length:630 start_codon:yes stop_codon:yes gene_type:complete
MANINTFIANITETGLSRANRYELMITAPSIPSLGNFSNSAESSALRFRVKSVNLPSKSIATSETKIYGPIRLAPYNITYDQLSFSVYLSDDMRERTYFENWMHYIFDYDTNRLRYYKEYSASDMKLMIMNEKNQTVQTYTFEESYPLSVGEIAFAYENEDVAVCDIGMTYRKYMSSGSYTNTEGRDIRIKKEKALLYKDLLYMDGGMA